MGFQVFIIYNKIIYIHIYLHIYIQGLVLFIQKLTQVFCGTHFGVPYKLSEPFSEFLP